MTNLDHDLERDVLIHAERATVFRFFTDPDLFARWWGAGSTIDAQVGGTVHIRYPNGIEAGGEVLEVEASQRVVFTFGYASGDPIPLGGSRVEVSFADEAEGTRVVLRHALPTAAVRDAHVAGWRYQLAVFANVAAAEQHHGVEGRVDALFTAWSEADPGRREALLRDAAVENVSFHDAYGCVVGRAELGEHIAALQMHMPGTALQRSEAVRQCQGTALVDWVAVGADGAERGKGSHVLELAPDGRIRRVVGFWSS